ncbi:SprT-like family-domain-containing protein [Mycena latifolia]|nr:SprT-like family-domain-containing protein [Mycena latifolia]
MSNKRSGPPGLGQARRDAKPAGASTPKKSSPKSSKWDGVEVIPDSEEERTRDDPNIIEISSDEDERIPNPRAKSGDPALRVPGAWPGSHASPLRATVATPRTPGTPTSSKKVLSRRPRVAESTSTDAAEDQIIVLADPELPTLKSKVPAKHFYDKGRLPRTPSPNKSARGTRRIVERSDSEVEVLGTPLQNPPKEKVQPLYEDDSDNGTSTSEEEPEPDPSNTIYDAPNKYAKYWTPRATPASQNGKVSTPSKASSSKSPNKSKQLSQAALLKLDEQAIAAKRVIYAEQVYSYLNKIVFKNRLPSLDEIGLIWNNRLATTAGRAQFHRDRHGNEFAEIHLASKVVVTDERIRNTLGHEMCHLACWMIDKEIREAHGKLFHKWAKRLERKDPDIEISVQHTYEIFFPFEWQCVKCNDIVGRHKKSFDITKGCPKCKGEMIALFDEPEPKIVSKLAAAKPQNSPRPPLRPSSPICISSDEEDEKLVSVNAQKEIYVVPDSDSESDQEITDLARKFGGITIAHRICLHAKRSTRK